MRAITNTIFLLLVAGLLQVASAQSGGRYTFTSETQLFIDGTSSLHDWTCEVEKSTGSFTTGEGAPFSIAAGTVSVLVDDIECGKGTMNSKLRDALTINNAKSVSFQLGSATVTGQEGGKFGLSLKGNLTIAGTTKPVTLAATGSQHNGMIHFEGKYALKQTDYGVDPPTALLGRLKTGDEVTVRFVVTAKAN